MKVNIKLYWFTLLCCFVQLFTSCGSGSKLGSDVSISIKNKNSIANLSLSLSTITVSQSELTINNSLKVTVNLINNNGTAFPSTSVTVDLSLSGGTSEGTLSSVTRIGEGVYEATFTGTKVGSAVTINGKVNDKILTCTLPTITVVPGNSSVANSILSLSSSTVVSGSSVTITLTAKDGDGNSLLKGGLNIAFSRSGGTSTGTISSVTDNSDGTYTATFTGVVAGSATTIGATIDGISVVSSLPTLVVSPGSYNITKSLVSVSASSVLFGSSITATLNVKDLQSNQLSSGGLTVLFSTSGGASSGTWSSVTDNNNGTYTATFTGTAVGSASSVTATINGISITSTLPTITVNGGPPSSIAISGAGNNQSASVGTLLGTALAVVVKDADNNLLSGINVDWSVTSGGGSLSLCTATTNASGISNCSYTLGTTPGANTITATVNGTAITTSFSETATIGAASKLLFVQQPSNAASGAAISPSITVEATDTYGNRITSYATNIDIAIDTNPSSGTLSGTTSQTPASGVSTFNNLSINYNGTGYKLIASSGALTTATSSAFNITATSVSYDWPFDAGSEASYVIGSNIDFSGGVARLSVSNDQTDDDNVSSYGFLTGTPYGVSYGTLIDGTTSGLKFASANGCDTTVTNCAFLDSTWTPKWGNIVSYWKMENNWNDSVGSNNGTATGATFSSGTTKIGSYSGSFNGTTNYVTVGTPAEFDFGTSSSFTIQAWVRTSSFASASGARIITNGMGPTLWNNGFNLEMYPSANVYAVGIGGGGTQTNSVYAYTTMYDFHVADWRHVVMVVNRTSNLISFYVNGIPMNMTLVASTCGAISGFKIDISACTSASATHSNTTTIGSYNGGTSAFWSGNIDEVAIWNVALTSSEVEAIYSRQGAKFAGTFTSRIMDGLSTNSPWTSLSWLTALPYGKELPDAGCSGSCAHNKSENSTSYTSLVGSTGATTDNNLMSGIKGLWHMDEPLWTGTPNEIIDSSGNENHGTSYNGATTMSAGVLGRGGDFSASGAYVVFPGFTWTPTSFSVAWWLLPRFCGSSAHTVGAVNTWGAFNFHSDAACDGYAGTSVGTRFVNFNLVGLYSRHLWTHYVFTFTGGTGKVYKNGVQVASKGGMANPTAWGGFKIGSSTTAWTVYGNVDEAAIWDRALHATEVKQLYLRGAAKLRFQVRTCDDNACSGETWKGPDGTSSSFFSEVNNNSNPFAVNGYVNPTPPSMVLANFTAAPSANRYFQYRTFFEGLYTSATSSFMPELKSVTVNPIHYSSSSPAVYGVNGLSNYSLVSLAETPGAGGCPSGITYNVSTDKVNWKYWDGSAWSLSAGTPANSNSASVISTNASSFTPHGGVAYIKALLNSTGSSKCEIDGLHLNGQN